jgi:uncharacterized protein YecE (DUF72 family)
MTPWIGTSGFQYSEWKGNFYPEDLATAKMLPFYAERFSTTEINYTFHRIPSAKTIENWKQQTPAKFRFSLKAPQKITHFARLRDCTDTLRYFYDVTSSLGEKLGPVLFQLPPNFKKDTVLLADFVNSLPGGMRSAFEFRHESWFVDEVFDALKTRGAALCIADMEEITTPPVATADYGYLRLRRADYTKEDVARWTEFVRGQSGGWGDVFVYFKHEEAGTGPRLAKQMTEILGEEGRRGLPAA